MRNLILIGLVGILSCGRKDIVVSTLEFPEGPIIEINNAKDTFEYPSFEDAVIITGYDSLSIINSINNHTQIDGNTFSTK